MGSFLRLFITVNERSFRYRRFTYHLLHPRLLLLMVLTNLLCTNTSESILLDRAVGSLFNSHKTERDSNRIYLAISFSAKVDNLLVISISQASVLYALRMQTNGRKWISSTLTFCYPLFRRSLVDRPALREVVPFLTLNKAN